MKNTKYDLVEFMKDCAFFFFAPIIFLFVVSFTGYEIFYSGGILKKRKVILLSLGATSYLIILLTSISLSANTST